MIWKGALHFNLGRDKQTVKAVVNHIMDGTLTGTDAWFQDKRSKVSSHIGIGKTGIVHGYVHHSDTAFHAGKVNKPTWKGIVPGVNPNLYTIGIEHEGHASDGPSYGQVETSGWWNRYFLELYSLPISPQTIIGHNEIDSVGKPYCPSSNKDFLRMVRYEAVRAGDPGFRSYMERDVNSKSISSEIFNLTYVLHLFRYLPAGEVVGRWSPSIQLAIKEWQTDWEVATPEEIAAVNGKNFGPKSRALANAILNL